MANPFIGEIRLFAGNYAPYGWLFCQGQELPINQYQALYSIVSTLYGTTNTPTQTFRLPDLRGYAPLGWGNGPGLTPCPTLGQKRGTATETLSMAQMPNHSHNVQCTTDTTATNLSNNPQTALWTKTAGYNLYGAEPNPATPMSAQALSVSGANGAHNNRQPYLGINFIINYDGEYLPRPY